MQRWWGRTNSTNTSLINDTPRKWTASDTKFFFKAYFANIYKSRNLEPASYGDQVLKIEFMSGKSNKSSLYWYNPS